ncbi:MAG: hypothetical protein KAU36_03465 [candidate division Zixibacteria bacterium]|nr:hypothetical protein [candidate division Zixibacteria bacterium]
MKTKSKTTVVILSTFILGAIVGALGNGALQQSRFEQFRRPITDERIVRFFHRIVDVEESQVDTVNAILWAFGAQMMEKRAEAFKEIIPMVESLRADLSEVLTDEQIAQMDNWQKQMEERGGPPFGKPADRRGPPRDGEWLEGPPREGPRPPRADSAGM